MPHTHAHINRNVYVQRSTIIHFRPAGYAAPGFREFVIPKPTPTFSHFAATARTRAMFAHQCGTPPLPPNRDAFVRVVSG